MVWKRIQRLLGRRGVDEAKIPAVGWIEAVDNPWGVRLLDVRPVTLTMLSVSQNSNYASNAVSFGQDDGTSFIGAEPRSDRITQASLEFPTDPMLADGVLFIPTEMEHKWALFHHRGEILCVRSWLREVQVVASLEQHPDHVEITRVRGTFGGEEEEPERTVRTLDFLLRSHVLDTPYPAPLPDSLESDPQEAAMWCMSMFGNRAWFATLDRFDRPVPEVPLRASSLLHLAVARGDERAIEESLAAGVPIDLLSTDGFAPLHWALASEDTAIMGLLIDRGSPVDVPSVEGATPLMSAVQRGLSENARLLIDRGADVDARDLRGFTALHRAAEMGHLDITRLLLERGATPDPEVDGHTPRSLAEGRGRADIVAVLDEGHRRD